jgi:uncharacterized protein YbbC (DUF1343 family)/CubicO group peptidase (beta-lactamase class C family)
MRRWYWRRRSLLQAAVAWSLPRPPAFGAASTDRPDAAPADWTPLDAAVRAQIAAGLLPGAVIVIGDARRLWLHRAWGRRAVAPSAEPMTADTVFDLASLTKVVATTTAVLQLVEQGRLDLDASAAGLWPGFAAHGKAAITLRQLLAHTSGLRPGLDRRAGRPGRAEVLGRVAAEAPLSPPGAKVLYSDLNFIVLGELVQRAGGAPLDAYVRRHILVPLGMHDSGFLPGPALAARIAPTEFVDGRWLRGTVHDPTARRMGGVAGHAGLFASAGDLARFAQGLLRAVDGVAAGVLAPASVEALALPQSPEAQAPWRGLGWELQAPLAAPGDVLPPIGAIGHTGYTGTGLWIDFVQRRFVVALSNRVHPDGRGDVRPLRRQVLALVSSRAAPLTTADLVAHEARFAAHLQPPPAEAPRATVATGIDRLAASAFAPLRGRRVGLVTNLSAIDAGGWRTLDRLRWAPGFTLAKVFSPEHGLYGDVEGKVASGVEPFSGLPLVSLYGEMRRPTAQSLAGLDALVFDVQDAGARFFTYITTMGEAMEAAALAGLSFVVLDRPNPLRADRVLGPVLDAGSESFTGYMALPVQHGMTIGELARLFRDEIRQRHGLDVELQVLEMRGYRRSMWFDATGLDWVPPSPNLHTPTTALLYPGVAWIEGANVSVGRGTEHPFEWIGAPWIDAPRLVRVLARSNLGGLGFAALDVTPASGPYGGRPCHGVRFEVRDRDQVDAPRLGLALLSALHQGWPDVFRLDQTAALVGAADVLEGVRGGLPLDELAARWQGSLDAFVERRRPFLLY